MSVQEKNEKVIKELETEVEDLTKHKTDLQTKYDYLKKRYRKLVAETEQQLDKSGTTNLNDSLTTPPPSFNAPFASPGAPHNNVRARIKSKPLRIDDADLSDDDVTSSSLSVSVDIGASVGAGAGAVTGATVGVAERVVTINDDEEVRQPLVSPISKVNNNGTFNH